VPGAELGARPGEPGDTQALDTGWKLPYEADMKADTKPADRGESIGLMEPLSPARSDVAEFVSRRQAGLEQWLRPCRSMALLVGRLNSSLVLLLAMDLRVRFGPRARPAVPNVPKTATSI